MISILSLEQNGPFQRLLGSCLTAERVRVDCRWVWRRGSCDPLQILVPCWSREECCDRPLFFHLFESSPAIPASWKGVFIRNRRWGLSSFMYLPIPSGSLWMLNGGTVVQKAEEGHATDCTCSHTCQRQWCAIRLQAFCRCLIQAFKKFLVKR